MQRSRRAPGGAMIEADAGEMVRTHGSEGVFPPVFPRDLRKGTRQSRRSAAGSLSDACTPERHREPAHVPAVVRHRAAVERDPDRGRRDPPGPSIAGDHVENDSHFEYDSHFVESRRDRLEERVQQLWA